MRDLNSPDPRTYWTDLAVTASVAWTAFAAAVALPGWWSAIATAMAAIASYRGLCFIHELTHLRPGALPGFETSWNLMFGVPLLLPSFVYVGVHQDHHKVSSYGTKHDPEYMPFAQSNLMTVVFAAHSVLIPFFLLVRFLVLSPFGLLFPPFQRWLGVYASSLTMNLAYKREGTEAIATSVHTWQLVILGVWGLAFTSMATGWLPWGALMIWYGVTGITSFVNTLRTLGAHRYESTGQTFDRAAQLADSVDTPGAPWTELWAPVGLRYHALHHYFPGIPYHNLPEAHRRLVGRLPSESVYASTLSPGLLQSLASLYRRGEENRAGQKGFPRHNKA